MPLNQLHLPVQTLLMKLMLLRLEEDLCDGKEMLDIYGTSSADHV